MPGGQAPPRSPTRAQPLGSLGGLWDGVLCAYASAVAACCARSRLSFNRNRQAKARKRACLKRLLANLALTAEGSRRYRRRRFSGFRLPCDLPKVSLTFRFSIATGRARAG
jgi:hypothetical protein